MMTRLTQYWLLPPVPKGAGTRRDDGIRVFGAIHISYNYEIDCKCVYRTITIKLINMGSRSFLFEHQMVHVEANQATTRNMTTNVFTEPYPLFHENDLGVFLLFYIKDYKCIYRTLLSLSWKWSGSVPSVLHQMLRVRSQWSDESKGKVTVDSERSESLFATALNQRTTYFRTLSQKSCANANLLTGPNDA